MYRRTFLGALALPVLAEIRRLLEGPYVNRGEIVTKRITGRRDGHRTELVRADAESRSVAPAVADLFDEGATDPLNVSDATAQRLRDRFEDVELVVAVRHHDRSRSKPDGGRPVEYRTIRALFNGLAIGNHVSFQTSLLRPRTLVSLSCVADDEDALRARCAVDIESDPTDEV
jgi:hypothetical protein